MKLDVVLMMNVLLINIVIMLLAQVTHARNVSPYAAQANVQSELIVLLEITEKLADADLLSLEMVMYLV